MSEQATDMDEGAVVEAQEAASGSRRVVLRMEGEGVWREVKTVPSRSEDHAIDQVAGKSGDPKCIEGRYKAIPASQWAGYRGVER